MTQRPQPGFRDREQAGAALGLALATALPSGDYVALGLLRGGVPIAAQVAQILGAELGVMTVRKIGVPSNPELALGALASYRGKESRVLNEDLHRRALASFGPGPVEDTEIAARESLNELAATFAQYAPEITGKIVIICDDGLATGASLRVALELARSFAPHSLIAAVPVAAHDELNQLLAYADRGFAVLRPRDFRSVGEYYRDFSPVSVPEVLSLLRSRQ